jgi:energy-coupling factor transporter ATP-binding protein EcfA2
MSRRHPSAERGRRTGRGVFVVVVGPDGSGKSTLARGLVEVSRPVFTEVVHIHWRPGVLPRAGSLVGLKAGDPTQPHAQQPHGRALSLALLTYDWVDFFIGTWLRILPIRARGGLVVMERGWGDMAVDPRRYHLDVPTGIVETLGLLLPGPDAALILYADPQLLRDRKAELPTSELARQLARWRETRMPRRTRRLFLDASLSPERLIDQAMDALRQSWSDSSE